MNVYEVETEMQCRDCAREIEEYIPVERADGSHKYVCRGCYEE